MTIKGSLPIFNEPGRRGTNSDRKLVVLILLAIIVASQLGNLSFWATNRSAPDGVRVPANAEQILQRCKSLNLRPGPDANFATRKKSDRYVPNTPSTLLKNATVWTGNQNGFEVLYRTDILLEDGLIKDVGDISSDLASKSFEVIDVGGAWVTPGIVDMHSHLGAAPSPALKATSADDNSRKGPILPWLRSLDSLNTHDDAYQLSIAGGVTTSLVLPGSANAIGGQAFPIKLRPTAERSPTSMLIEIPSTLNGSHVDDGKKPVWRHMKHACGENPGRVYSMSRMDTYWAFREAYNQAKQIKDEQDSYCAKVGAGRWEEVSKFPESLQWEALVDVLRGRVKVHTHCYETVDLDAIVRLTNEFQFPVAAFHHAHEAYLAVDILKKAWGTVPAVAIFATNARYKREAYRGSEYAAAILAQNGLRVVMKSDHPVLDSRFLLYEAQQAHFYGLQENLALASVTSTPAQVMELDHRLGFIRTGYDADIVVWDSHPLALGATPLHVYIDGISQLKSPTSSLKPDTFQLPPVTPDFSREAAETLKYDGLPPLISKKVDNVLFVNVTSIWLRQHGLIQDVTPRADVVRRHALSVLVCNGTIVCADYDCCSTVSSSDEIVDLQGGSISPGLIAYGPDIGLEEIQQEKITRDGTVFDPLSDRVPGILGGRGSLIRAVDGLKFQGRDLLLAYRAGITSAVTAPSHNGFLAGLGTAFRVGAEHKLERGAIIQNISAVHIAIHPGGQSSVSTQIATLRNLLSGGVPGEVGLWFERVANGEATLVIEVESADIIASILSLKAEIEEKQGTQLKITLSGAAEAHILAGQLSSAGVGVILNPSRPFPTDWEKQRIMPGPPISELNVVAYLLEQNVTVGIGVEELWSSRNVRLDAEWAAIDSKGRISKANAFAIASTNLEKLLGVHSANDDLVATVAGDLLTFGSKVAAVISGTRGITEIF